MKHTVLVVDDAKDIADLIEDVLKGAGYKVHHVTSADAAFAYLQNTLVDLILLDINLPGISGLKLLELLRQEPRTAHLPVIMITSMGTDTDKIKGLEKGADDYLPKPFSLGELLARVNAVMRRTGQPKTASSTIEFDQIQIDFDKQEVTVKNKRVHLTQAEFDLLAHLMKRQGNVLSYQNLIEALSSGYKDMTSESLYVHMMNLRKKLGTQGVHIETIRGFGYKLA